jgi:TolB-like protein/DNA-binding winged helix-turn-helix (wHTH) protein/Tfp pilus assembly protein PilF
MQKEAHSRYFYEFGDFRFDMQGLMLFRADSTLVAVTPKALEILRILVECSGQVVSKDELMRQVWADSFVEEANLSYYIFQLRKALDEGNGYKFIETVSKRGYRFIAELKQVPAFTPGSEAKAEVPRALPWKIPALAALLLFTTAAGWFFYQRHVPAELAVSKANSIQSIAVMPFQNDSGNEEIEYLADGMTEALISSLSQLPDLKVKARSSVFRYKSMDIGPRTVGSELGVQAVLNGRVVQRGEDLTLFLSLIDAETENQIWGRQYVRKLKSLLILQSEVARDVSESLRLKLSGTDNQKITKNYTENVEAYNLYLQGRFWWNKFTGDGLRKAIGYFEEAIEKDKNYALAYAGLANSYNVLGVNGHMPVAEARPRVRNAAETAIALDDQLAEAHQAFGANKLFFDWDFEGAEHEFKRAIQLDPGFATPHELYAYILRSQGKFDEALGELRIAQELDPLDLLIADDIGATLRYAGRTADAIEANKKTFEMDPNYPDIHFEGGLVFSEHGMHDRAIAELQQAVELSNRETHIIAGLAIVCVRAGKTAKARKVLGALLAGASARYVSPLDIAMIYSVLNEWEKAFEWLEKAYAERTTWLFEMKVEPCWKNIRSDPRFADIARRVGLEK